MAKIEKLPIFLTSKLEKDYDHTRVGTQVNSAIGQINVTICNGSIIQQLTQSFEELSKSQHFIFRTFPNSTETG